MSMAFEITEDDVANVLDRFASAGQYDGKVNSEQAFEDYIADEDDRIEKAALRYVDMDDQTNSALHEIGEILIEKSVVQGPNPYESNLA